MSFSLKRKLLLVFIALVVGGGLLGGLFFSFSSISKLSFKRFPPKEKIAKEVERAKKDLSLLERAVKTKNADLCQSIKEKETCLELVAEVAANIAGCQQLADQEKREKCITFVASTKGDDQFCRFLDDQDRQNRCKQEVVGKTFDQKICETLPSHLAPYSKEKCYLDVAVKRKEIGLCKKAGQFKDVCRYQVAVLNKEVEQCRLVKDEALKNFCLYYLSVQSSRVRPCHFINKDPLNTLCVALASDKSYFCELIKDYQVQSFCKQELAQMTKTPELCEGDKECLTKLARLSFDPSFCNYIPAGFGQVECKIALALESGDQGICTQLEKSQQERCYYQLALKTGQPAYCDKIAQKEFTKIPEISRSRCLTDLARFKSDLYICEKISDPKKRASCKETNLWDAFRGNQDPEFCQKIKGDPEAKVDDFDFKLCYYYTALNTHDYSLCARLKEMALQDKLETGEKKFWLENVEKCKKQTLAYLERKYLASYGPQPLGREEEAKIEDPIVIKAYPQEGVTQLAERALNRYLAKMTTEELRALDFKITPGHRIYIEDYIADRLRPKDHLVPGQELAFPRELILQAIDAARSLNKEQLEHLSQYTFAREEISPELLQNQALSYCDFRVALSHYYQIEDKELDKILCQIELTGNYELCEQFEKPGPRALCYEQIAKKTDNYKVCERFKKGDNQKFCYENFASRLAVPEICENFENNYDREHCLLKVAQAKPDPRLCEMMKENVFYERSNCYKAVALDQQDASFCEKITHTDTKKWCLIELAKQLGDPSLCEKVKKEISPLYPPGFVRPAEEDCYDALGREKDPQYCGFILGEDKKFMCYRAYYEEHKQEFFHQHCEDLSGFKKDYCYTTWGEMTNNLKDCSFIETEAIQDFCEYQILLATKDRRCEMIKSPFFRDSCYSKVAQATKDYMLCLKIKGDYERGRCVNNIANLLKSREPCKILEKDNYFKKTCGDLLL